MSINMNTDLLWKIFTVILGTLIMPLAGWVWNTNVQLAELQNDVSYLQTEVQAMEEELKKVDDVALTLVAVERDIQHVREILNRIEELIAQ
jgi:Tfp pilus assembly protein PilN